MESRLLLSYIKSDLKKKMVFLGGPRQCGKTTLAKTVLSQTDGTYLNWDLLKDRKKILQGDWHDEQILLVFDEIHKYKNWKSLVKGYFDTEREKHQFLVTGSARLDLYQRGGDSLVGRYHYWRLHPFSLFDHPKGISPDQTLSRLLNVGGFPEVFLDNNEREARRWRETRTRRILLEDVRDLESIQNIHLLEILIDHLRARVGSTLSMLSLAQEIGVSSVTIKKWIQILEKMYLIFVIHGYDKKITRAVHKPIKVYFYDNAEVDGDESIRFENLVANHLLQKNHFLEDYHGYRMGMYYVKDKNQREVDFLVTQNSVPQELFEVKLSDVEFSKNLVAFADLLKVKAATQVVLNLKMSKTKNALRLRSPLEIFHSKNLDY